MKIELLESTPNAEILIEKAMRSSHGGSVDPDGIPNKTFIQKIISYGHESPVEHASATFLISDVSRALSHQLVRHRLASFTQKSQRYCKEDNFEYIVPPKISENENLHKEYVKIMDSLKESYQFFRKNGILAEDARYVLPNACTTSLVMTMNFREFRSFFKLRCAKDAQWEIRILAENMLKELYNKFPCIFSDIFLKFFP